MQGIYIEQRKWFYGFGSLKGTGNKDFMRTVAISSPHVIDAGTVACLPNGERFGECIWPDK